MTPAGRSQAGAVAATFPAPMSFTRPRAQGSRPAGIPNSAPSWGLMRPWQPHTAHTPLPRWTVGHQAGNPLPLLPVEVSVQGSERAGLGLGERRVHGQGRSTSIPPLLQHSCPTPPRPPAAP